MTENPTTKNIIVFIASPGDLENEREQFRNAIKQLNVEFADGANVKFEALGWEDSLASTGRRNQSVINAEIDRCDVFFLVMHKRWGQESPDAEPYSSYTEEEFYRALNRWETTKSPEIFVFFKYVDAKQEANPDLQLQQVLKFRKQLEDTRKVMYRYSGGKQNKPFLDEVDNHLRAYVKGELNKIDPTRDKVILPLSVIEEINKEKEQTLIHKRRAEKENNKSEVARLRVVELQLEAAEDAASFAKEGLLERARQKFIKLISETLDIRVLHLAHNFFDITGDLDSVLVVLNRWLSLSGAGTKSSDTAIAYGYLGVLYNIRGNIEQAEAMCKKSLVLNELLDRKEGMAINYENLARLYETKGDLSQTEIMYKKSLELHISLGRKEGMAANYGNIGSLHMAKGKLDLAETTIKKSLEINGEINNKEGEASNYGNLGILYESRGDLNDAEAMHKKALEINQKLGRKKGMAVNYGNIGNIYKTRGNFDQAKIMYEKSLEIDQSLGWTEGMAKQYGNLGILYQIKEVPDLDRAETMHKKALAINDALGRQEGIASQCGNLGILYRTRGDLDRSEAMHKKSLKLYEELGRKEGIASQYRNLGTLYQEKDDPGRAETMYKKALEINVEIGLKKGMADNYGKQGPNQKSRTNFHGGNL